MNVAPGSDGKPRCTWSLVTPGMQEYHDAEWGFASRDDRFLFEHLCLEAFQSGLSWRTILERRDGFRAAFHGFNPEAIARFDDGDVERLMQDSGIIRNRAKIEAVIHNAARFLDLDEPLADLAWQFEPPRRTPTEWAAVTPESEALAKALKQHGWKFFGPTTAFAFMQSVGIVNDHAPSCFVRDAAEASRHRVASPTKSPDAIGGAWSNSRAS